MGKDETSQIYLHTQRGREVEGEFVCSRALQSDAPTINVPLAYSQTQTHYSLHVHSGVVQAEDEN